jgi:hypothetical protein
MIVSMLTTVDNPHDPFDDYDSWYQWDERAAYHTPSFLARVAIISVEMSEPDQVFAINSAIDEIVKENVTGVYRKVTRDIPVG